MADSNTTSNTVVTPVAAPTLMIDNTSNTVVNIIVATPDLVFPGFTLIPVSNTNASVHIGYTYANGTFSPPPPPVVPLATLKAQQTTIVQNTLDQTFAAGFQVPNTVSVGLAGKVLQTATQTDQINWLTSQAAYLAAVSSGQGNTAGATFRAADNSVVTVSFAEGLNTLLALASWGATIYKNSWRLKDAITAAPDANTVQAIDVTQGWPAQPANT